MTVPSPSIVSKSMVTQKGVPASSMRRYRLVRVRARVRVRVRVRLVHPAVPPG